MLVKKFKSAISILANHMHFYLNVSARFVLLSGLKLKLMQNDSPLTLSKLKMYSTFIQKEEVFAVL